LFTLALFVADILMFAVIVHNIVSAGVLLGVTVGMVARSVNPGEYYPYPSGLGEVFIGALRAHWIRRERSCLVVSARRISRIPRCRWP